jgi:integrase
VELLRWSGMAQIDAVQYRPELVDADGVIRYRRQKTGELATVQLPEHVIALLRNVPLERDSVGSDHPFRMKDFTPHSDTVTWRKRLMKLFALAGIKEVRNELGKSRRPHPHMLRDTFAVWNLRHGVPLHAVAKMLGHSNPTTTAKAYLPWVKELEQATIAEARNALKKAAPKAVKGQRVVRMTNP